MGLIFYSTDVKLVGWITVNQCRVIDIPCLEVESGKKIAWYYTSNISAVPSEWYRLTDDKPKARRKPSKNSKSLNICLTYRTDNGIYLYQAEDTNTYFGWNFTVSEHKIKENGIIFVELGSNVTLPCLIRNELQHIVWKFMPQMNVCEQIDMKVFGDTSKSIKILNLKSSDIGVYEYQAEYTKMETEYFSWKLSHVPIVEVHVDSNQVKTKTDKTIYCKVIGDMGDCSNITWHLQPYDKPEHSINLKATNKYFVGPKQEPSLTILQFDSTDVGVYKCLAFNTENLVGESKPVKLIQSFPRRVSVKEISFTLNIEQIEEEVEYKRIAVIDTPGVRTSMGQENINKTVGMLKKQLEWEVLDQMPFTRFIFRK
ncbi:unnamed protein product [Mytilus edulis]|uniref:Ig-like domain-containing protein n=1 Tax=Mytilus edulis TaxID=6550 RepID=A0A8S3RDG6_MYTED|nr:unnamed protein product [Mytilus edulis]